MGRHARYVILITLLLAGASMAGLHFLVQGAVSTNQFRTYAESKLEESLYLKVGIGRIRVRFFHEVELSNLKLQPIPGREDYSLRIRRILFRYRLLDLLKRRFETPLAVHLDAPSISLSGNAFFADFVQPASLQPPGLPQFGELELDEGTLDYLLPEISSKLRFHHVRGSVTTAGPDKVCVSLQGTLQGLLSGLVRVEGEISRLSGIHALRFDFEKLRFQEDHPLGLEELSGSVRLEDQELFFEDLKFDLQGWQLWLTGRMIPLAQEPVLEVKVRIGHDKPLGTLEMTANVPGGRLRGTLHLHDGPSHDLQGKIRRDDLKLYFDELRIDETIDGEGELDFAAGTYGFSFNQGSQRFYVVSRLKDRRFNLSVDLSHAELFGMDLVAKVSAQVRPETVAFRHGRFSFFGNFQSDYFLLDQTALRDLRGTFEIYERGIKNIKAQWGAGFSFKGDVSFLRGPWEGKFELEVSDFNLSELDDYQSDPIQKNLRGDVEGKLKIEGALDRPEIIGSFRVKNGALSKIDYDQAIIHLRGFLPYLALRESKILKGRTELNLTGALDFSLVNPFYGVRIETADKLILWRGMVLRSSGTEGDGEMITDIMKLPIFRIMLRQSPARSRVHEHDHFQEEGYLAAGPKIQF